jgi:predicted RNase H-like HicB family nuclease
MKKDRRYIPIKDEGKKTYFFQAEVAQEDDGRWSAWINALPGCATWGYTESEALEALREAAQAYVEVMLEKGQKVPIEKAIQTVGTPVVPVSL